ncbi:MAG TPA: nuclear transport factor 2 family protein [Rhodocyclaceae bacterium]|nr:nuclear transport factor 2 family protein [Rhodocyclaceae bacterium]
MNQLIHFSTPEEAERAFYDALSSGDTDALMAIWSPDEEIVCVHPTGVQLTGEGLIRDSWQSIFGTARLRVRPEPVAQWHGMLLSIHHLVETLFVGDDPAPHGPLHVTHVYSKGAHGWRLVSRHASAAAETKPSVGEPEPPRTLH